MNAEGRSAICRYCQEGGLKWTVRQGTLMLIAPSGQPHACEGMTRFVNMQNRSKPAQAKTKGYKPPPPIEPCPPEGIDNYAHPWWSFLDAVEMPMKKGGSAAKFQELVP